MSIIISERKDNIILPINMSSSTGVTEQSFGNGPAQISPPAFAEDKGGAAKPSQILGSIAGISGPIAALAPVTAPLLAPISAIAGIGSAIAKLFGGGLTQNEMDMIMAIRDRVDQRRDVRGVVGSPAN